MNGSLLDVSGARLYHEVHGSGDAVLLLIPGGNGDAGPYAPLARALAGAGYTVVSYDRRGYSRSPASGPPPPEGWLAEDVTDALALLDRYSPGAPACVMGSSSGAIPGPV
jgi:alpha-beta hydrolase superfamily lysophospholipase